MYDVSTLEALPPERARKLDTLLGDYALFRKTYRKDPVSFVRECFIWPSNQHPALYQEEILEAIVHKRRVSVRGPHGLGKTALTSWAILWFALTRDGAIDWKIPATASAWRQLQKFLFPELRKWINRLNWKKIGRDAFVDRQELLDLSLKLSTGEAFALASDNSALIEGAHASTLLYVFDESKSIPYDTWDSAEGAFSTGDCYWLAVSTPGDSAGRFYDIQTRKPGYEDWFVRRITLEETIRAGRVSRDWAESRRRQWGENSPVYKNRVLGEFAEGAGNGLIPLAWIEAANERWEAWREAGFPGNLTALGNDVGGGEDGSDKSTIAVVYDGLKVKELRSLDVSDPNTALMGLVGVLSGILEAEGKRMNVPARYLPVIIDSIGIGLGVLDRMRELGYNASGFVASKGTKLRDKSNELGFANWRSAAWWLMREMLAPGSGFNVCLPPDDTLTGDLSTPTYAVTSNGLIQVEGKEKIRLRLRRSTDSADAVLHALVGPVLLQEEAEGDQTYYIVH